MSRFIQFFIFFFIPINSNGQEIQSELDKMALENFREYLRIPSVHPNINYNDCLEFLKKQAESLELPFTVYEIQPKKPIFIITWEGLEPEKPSILLNGHMDVVPVDSEKWNHPPFAAEMDKNGNIFARGAQDMKSVSIQHIEAIRRLKLRGIQLKRTIHISFVPDEEIPNSGMEFFAQTDELKNLNIGFALDEGNANEGDKFNLNYAERSVYQIWIHSVGKSGHGSILFDETAGEKLRIVIDRFMDFRAMEKEKLKDPTIKTGNVTTINLTMLRGGTQINVLPTELSVAFDIRIAPHVNITKFEEMINKWCKEAGDGVYYSIISKSLATEVTKLDSTNIYWIAFKKMFDDNFLDLDIQIKAGASDSRFLRAIGISALGFSPMNETPLLAHANNEFLNKNVFLKGIGIFEKIILAVANV